MADEDGEARRRREGRERLPVDVFGQDRSENSLAWLVGSKPSAVAPPEMLANLTSQINLASNVIAALSTLETGQFFSASLAISSKRRFVQVRHLGAQGQSRLG